jgi:hypothetical protein
MFLQALNVALRILLFRAGPQDLPYSPQLTQVIAPLTVAANYLVFAQVLPALMSLAMAAAAVGGLALVVRGLLKARNLENRYLQAIHALWLCSAILTAALAIPFTEFAPVLLEMAQKPELLEDPGALQVPQGAALLMNLLNIWNFAVTVYILRSAADAGIGLSLLFAVFAALAVAFLVVVCGSVVGALAGGPAQ